MAARFPDHHHASRADYAACRSALRVGSRSFFAASLLLPRRVRKPALVLYAFCRAADDAVDEGGTVESLALLRERQARIYDGRPFNHPADRALADVVAEHKIPREPLEALLEGFQWDIEGRRYADLEELIAYAERVAGTVGVMMSHLMNVRAPEALARACDLGVAMQLTNVARDVGEDARAGRLYIPTSWLRQQDIDPDTWLNKPEFTPGIAHLVQRLLEAADERYERADAGIRLLPWDCQPGIAMARHLYADIGEQLQRAGCDSITRRTVVPLRRKLQILTTTLLRTFSRAQRQPTLEARAEWLVGLFERLERRDRQLPDRTI